MSKPQRLRDALDKAARADRQFMELWKAAPWEVRRFLPELRGDYGQMKLCETGDYGTYDEIMVALAWLGGQLGDPDE